MLLEGITVSKDTITFKTPQFDVGPGQERFICFAYDTPADLVVDGYSHRGRPVLHHVILSSVSSTAREPTGFSECDVLYKFSWNMLYSSGAGNTAVNFPAGSGHVFRKGTQLVAQLHLLNSSLDAVTDFAQLSLHPSTATNPRPISTYAFGATNIKLPPLTTSSVIGNCTMKEDVELIAAFPHMHKLATSLTFEVGPSPDALTMAYSRAPYDFNNQAMDMIDLKLHAGDVTRLTCNYNNTRSTSVDFGESTNSEMCFLVGMAIDRSALSGCFDLK
jgi:hypothetical protein